MERRGKRGRMERRTKLPHAYTQSQKGLFPRHIFISFLLPYLRSLSFYLTENHQQAATWKLQCQSQVKNAIANSWEITF